MVAILAEVLGSLHDPEIAVVGFLHKVVRESTSQKVVNPRQLHMQSAPLFHGTLVSLKLALLRLNGADLAAQQCQPRFLFGDLLVKHRARRLAVHVGPKRNAINVVAIWLRLAVAAINQRLHDVAASFGGGYIQAHFAVQVVDLVASLGCVLRAHAGTFAANVAHRLSTPARTCSLSL